MIKKNGKTNALNGMYHHSIGWKTLQRSRMKIIKSFYITIFLLAILLALPFFIFGSKVCSFECNYHYRSCVEKVNSSYDYNFSLEDFKIVLEGEVENIKN